MHKREKHWLIRKFGKMTRNELYNNSVEITLYMAALTDFIFLADSVLCQFICTKRLIENVWSQFCTNTSESHHLQFHWNESSVFSARRGRKHILSAQKIFFFSENIDGRLPLILMYKMLQNTNYNYTVFSTIACASHQALLQLSGLALVYWNPVETKGVLQSSMEKVRKLL